MNDCIFCKIITGQIPCAKVYENEHVLCFLEIHPCVKGHVLVVPKQHFRNVFDATKEQYLQLHEAAQLIAKKLKQNLSCDGVNIFQNNESCAGQDVFHAHIHVVPRHTNDGKKLAFNTHDSYVEGELNTFTEKIKN